MTPLAKPKLYDSPIDLLRHMVNSFDWCDESFLEHKTIPQLLNIYQCWMRCGWDIMPDEWTQRQVMEAMRGICPDWVEQRGVGLKPVFHADRKETRKVTVFRLVAKET
jgi:hypothetical protein